MELPFFVSFPHSGEEVPLEATWLRKLPEVILMCDVDRYVDQLYNSSILKNNIQFITTKWHRYAADLNRLSSDTDELSVQGAVASGRFAQGIGLHWARTTQGDTLIKDPMAIELHELLVEKYHRPFHDKIKLMYDNHLSAGATSVYQLDLHSMPSKGTSKHPDPGEDRAEIVISDLKGTSCSEDFKSLVIQSYKEAGFEVVYNWPYKGGRVTELYGDPSKGQHVVQVEINRKIYMDEVTKKKNQNYNLSEAKLGRALDSVYTGLCDLV